MNKSILIALCGVALSASAQNLSTEIDVERTVDVRETAASPLSTVTPTIIPNPNTPQPLSMSEYTLTGVPGVMADTLPPADATGIPGRWPYRGYVSLGYLPVFNLDLRAGYSLVNNSASRLDAGIRYTGESHTGALTDYDSKIKATNNNFAVTLRGAHRFSNVISMSGNASYEHYAVSSPGLNPNAEKFSRGADGASLNLSVTGKHRVNWTAGVNAQYMGFSKPLMDSEAKPSTFIIGADARAQYAFSHKAAVELNLGVDHLHRGGNAWIFPGYYQAVYAEIANRNSTVCTLNPAFLFASGKFSVKAGVRLDLVTYPGSTTLYLSPDVLLAYRSSLLTVWLECNGQARLNSLSEFMAYSPYMAGVNSAGVSHAKAQATLGLRIGGAQGLSGTLLGYCADVTDAAAISVVNNALSLTSMDRNGGGFGVRLDYAVALMNIRAHAGMDFYSNSHDNVYPTADLASSVMHIGVSATPIKALNVAIDWKIRHGRKYVEYSSDSGPWQYISMGCANNLSLDAVYQITPALSAGIKLENLLCRRWLLVPGVYSPRLHGLLTAQLNF